jgi:Trypsin-like serine proteases, typically periplasmic, contain C-terminal PDZ domain
MSLEKGYTDSVIPEDTGSVSGDIAQDETLSADMSDEAGGFLEKNAPDDENGQREDIENRDEEQQGAQEQTEIEEDDSSAESEDRQETDITEQDTESENVNEATECPTDLEMADIEADITADILDSDADDDENALHKENDGERCILQDAGKFGPRYLRPSRYSEEKEADKKQVPKRSFYVMLVSLCAVVALIFGSVGAVVTGLIMKNMQPQPEPQPYPFEESGMDIAVSGVSWSSVVEAVAPSVVEIYTSGRSGSGVIISEDGYIITNDHVVRNRTEFDVVLYNKVRYAATLIGTDPETDIAIIKVEATGLTAVRYGLSSDVHVGDKVIAVGNALGELPLSVTEGIVSFLEREVPLENGLILTLMQISVPVSPGNSGGGLFNARGELIGIVNMKMVGMEVEGIAFAVPADTARKVSIDYIGRDVTGRSSIGVDIKFINTAKEAEHYGAEDYGLFIIGLDAGAAAEKAGLMLLDHIVAVDGHYVLSEQLFFSIVERHRPGDKVAVEIVRGGETLVISVVVEFKSSPPL